MARFEDAWAPRESEGPLFERIITVSGGVTRMCGVRITNDTFICAFRKYGIRQCTFFGNIESIHCMKSVHGRSLRVLELMEFPFSPIPFSRQRFINSMSGAVYDWSEQLNCFWDNPNGWRSKTDRTFAGKVTFGRNQLPSRTVKENEFLWENDVHTLLLPRFLPLRLTYMNSTTAMTLSRIVWVESFLLICSSWSIRSRASPFPDREVSLPDRFVKTSNLHV